MARTQLKFQTGRSSDAVQLDDRPALRAVPASDRAPRAIAVSSQADRRSVRRDVSVAVAVVLAAFGGLAYLAGLAVALVTVVLVTTGITAWGYWVLNNTFEV